MNLADKHYSDILGPTLGFFVVVFLISGIPYGILFEINVAIAVRHHPPGKGLEVRLLNEIIQGLGNLVVGPLLFPLTAGFSAVFLAQLNGQPWTFGRFFSGFQHFGTLATLGLATQLVAFVFVSVPTIFLVAAALLNRAPELLLASPLIVLFGLVCMIFFYIRLFLFDALLVFDRNLTAGQALKANWELTRGHFVGLFGVTLLVGLIGIAGVLACGVGLLFSIPYALLILSAGYVIITGGEPPPDRYDE
jgi:hypothetical protein